MKKGLKVSLGALLRNYPRKSNYFSVSRARWYQTTRLECPLKEKIHGNPRNPKVSVPGRAVRLRGYGRSREPVLSAFTGLAEQEDTATTLLATQTSEIEPTWRGLDQGWPPITVYEKISLYFSDILWKLFKKTSFEFLTGFTRFQEFQSIFISSKSSEAVTLPKKYQKQR